MYKIWYPEAELEGAGRCCPVSGVIMEATFVNRPVRWAVLPPLLATDEIRSPSLPTLPPDYDAGYLVVRGSFRADPPLRRMRQMHHDVFEVNGPRRGAVGLVAAGTAGATELAVLLLRECGERVWTFAAVAVAADPSRAFTGLTTITRETFDAYRGRIPTKRLERGAGGEDVAPSFVVEGPP